MEKQYFVYIMASRSRVLYTGMTNNLDRRVYEHKHKLCRGFTARYNVTQLVYYESARDVHGIIQREKEIKKWRREKKIKLIETMNPEWKDLSEYWDS